MATATPYTWCHKYKLDSNSSGAWFITASGGCWKQCEQLREKEERKRQCNLQLSGRLKLVGYLPLVETLRSIVWVSVPCASPVRASGGHQRTGKKPSQYCAAPLNWVST